MDIEARLCLIEMGRRSHLQGLNIMVKPDELRYSSEDGDAGIEMHMMDEEALEISSSLSLHDLWDSDPEVHQVLRSSKNFSEVRRSMRSLLSDREEWLHSKECDLEELERYNAFQCIRVLRNFLSPRNEDLTGTGSIRYLWKLAKEDVETMREVSKGFVVEMMHLLKGSLGDSGIYTEKTPSFLDMSGREAARIRSDQLDSMAAGWMSRINSYVSGLEPEVVDRRAGNRRRILDYFGGKEEDWQDYRWHMRNVIKTPEPLVDLLRLTPSEKEAVRLAAENGIPFGITPYYLSLMDYESDRSRDHAVRSQVIPPLSYVRAMLEHRDDREFAFDFMREHDTSPVDLVTRRYPMIAIMKPYNTCAQICVYCQRNWEIDEVLSPTAMASTKELQAAIEWFRKHPAVIEVLITGGDPALVSDSVMDKIMERVSSLEHVERIRIGTRTPVVLPMRITEEFADTLAKYHELPDREVCVVSHYEHPYEVTPESMQAVQRLRRRGMNVYNQQVFTMENSRRFETAALRLVMKKIGVDPYYAFNTKGKEETGHYRVPIARLLQERKEEARVLPGITRTDEPVFNIPGMGKNHLRAWQHHEYIMLSPEGERYYEFHPWEKNISLAPTYIYKDVSLHDYLERLEKLGENPEDYRTIWYYF